MLIGARQSLWRGGRLSAKSYVQEGLIFQLDGIDNRGAGQHSSETRKWVDLIGGEEFTLSDDAVVLDRSISFRGGSATGVINFPKGVKTVESVVLKLLPSSEIQSYYHYIVYGASGVYSYYDLFGVPYAGFDGWWKSDFPPSLGGDKFSRTDLVGDTYEMFINGRLWEGAERNNPWAKRGEVGTVKIPYDFYGEVAAVRVYSRLLSPSEILENYAIDKERFNI